MIKHIVAWKLKEQAEGRDARDNAKLAKQKLEALNGKIAGLLKLEVGIDFSRTQVSADIVLYSEFPDRAALDSYQAHPLHKEVKVFMGNITAERRVADYNV